MLFDKKREVLKQTRPYMVIHCPEENLSAVYDRRYSLLFECASDRLLQYAKTNNTQMRKGFRLTKLEQQPSWITDELKEECICYHCYNDGTSNAIIAKIPEE